MNRRALTICTLLTAGLCMVLAAGPRGPKAKAQRDAELLPLLWRRRAVLAAGAISGLGLLLFQLRGLLRRKKQSRPLAEPRE